MIFENWMICEPLISDGAWTIGYVDEKPAEWAGNMAELTEGADYSLRQEGNAFGVDHVDQYVVKNGLWLEARKNIAKNDYVRPSIHLRVELDEQIKSRGTRSTIITRDLERLYTLYRRALQQARLSVDEACLVVDALNGSIMDATPLLWANIEDSIQLDGLDQKWSIDGPALVEKLRGLNDIQVLAVVDGAERFWADETLHSRDIREMAKSCFAIK